MKYFALSFVVSMVVLGGIMSMSYGEELTCFGEEATIVGTDNSELIVGTNGDDVIVALGGNDKIHAFGGNDIVCPGLGTNEVFTGTGDDTIITESVGIIDRRGAMIVDKIDAGDGNDACYVDDNEILTGCENVFTREQAEEDSMSGEEPSVLLIDGHELVNVQGRAIDNTLINDFVKVDTTISFTGEPGERSEISRVTTQITDPDGTESTKFTLLNRIGVGETQIFSSPQVKLTKSGTYTFVITVNEGANGQGILIDGPVTLTVTTPAITGLFTASDLTIRDRDTGDIILGGIQTEDIVRIGAIVNNDQATEVTYFFTIDIDDPDFSEDVAFNRTIDLATTEDTIFATWGPLKAGTYTITLSIFDNGTARNPLITPLQLSVVVTGVNVLTFDDLVQKVSELEARIIALEAQH